MGLISVSAARELVLRHTPRLGDERVAVADALDRVLALDLRAAADVPPFACSAMDGYAVAAGPAGRKLAVSGESRAGRPSTQQLGDHAAIRISTGAAVPGGATAVIRQEDVAEHDGVITTKADVAELENIRAAGEDMRSGTTVLCAGTRLGVAELGATVAAGAGAVTVARRPRVHIVCTGDELRAPGEPLGPGEIHNSNGPMLVALASRCGAHAQSAERVGDDRTATESALGAALKQSDVVVISGGVSVGPHDHVKPTLSQLGVEEVFWGVALQPGKPTWFGRRDRCLVFGLPGNPVSSVVTFVLFAAPALAAMQGTAPGKSVVREAALATNVARNPRREQALRVRLEQSEGALVAVPTGPQGSHMVSSLIGAEALAMIPSGDGVVAAGTAVSLEHLPR